MRRRKGHRKRATRGRVLLLGLAHGLVLILWLSAADGGNQIVLPIPPPPPPHQLPQVPTLAPAADLSGLAGRTIARVGVVLEGNVWSDVAVPNIRDVKAGDVLTPEAARRALAELLGSGQFARARATATAESSGVALILHAAPRKLVGRLEMDLHGAG